MPAQNPETQNIPNPTQTQPNPNPNPKELIIRLWQKYKEKVLEELMREINEIIEKRKDTNITEKLTNIYALVKLGMYKNDLENSIKFDERAVERVIRQGWSVNDIVCKYEEVYMLFNEIVINCRAPNDNRFFFSVMLKEVSDLSKDEYMRYATLRNMILVEKYKKMIEELYKELSKQEEDEEDDC